MAAGAWIHGRDQHDGCRVSQGGIHPRDRHAAILQRLTQAIQDMPLELKNFIEEEHAMMSQRDLAWFRDSPAADESRI